MSRRSSRSRWVTRRGSPLLDLTMSATRRRSAPLRLSSTCDFAVRASSKSSSHGRPRRRERRATGYADSAAGEESASSSRTAAVTSVGLDALRHRLLRHHALGHVAARRQLELHVEQDLLDDRPQSPRSRLALERLLGDRGQGVVGEDELDAVELEEALELLDQRVARLGEDRDEVVARELVDGADDGQAADELGDQAVVDEVLRQDLLEDVPGVALDLGLDRRAEADALGADAALDDPCRGWRTRRRR